MGTRVLLALGAALFVATPGEVSTEPITATTIAAVAAAAASVVQTGVSFSSLNPRGISHKCTLEVENWTKWPLTMPHTEINYGAIQTPAPLLIGPGLKEKMMFVRDSEEGDRSRSGTTGVVSYAIFGDSPYRVYFMWKVPYWRWFRQRLYSNKFGVGISSSNIYSAPQVFDVMEMDVRPTYVSAPWYEFWRTSIRVPSETWRSTRYSHLFYNWRKSLYFTTRKYDNTRSTSLVSTWDRASGSSGGSSVVVEATMGTTYHAEAYVRVRPTDTDDLSPEILERYNLRRGDGYH